MKLLNVGGIAGKADTIGYLAAVFAGSPQGLDDIISSIQQIMAGQIHAPSVTSLQSLGNEPYLKNAVLAYAAGLGIEALKPPVIGQYGNAIQKGAMAYGIGVVLNKLLWSMTHSRIVGENVYGKSVQENFSNAPLAQRYY